MEDVDIAWVKRRLVVGEEKARRLMNTNTNTMQPYTKRATEKEVIKPVLRG